MVLGDIKGETDFSLTNKNTRFKRELLKKCIYLKPYSKKKNLVHTEILETTENDEVLMSSLQTPELFKITLTLLRANRKNPLESTR